MQLHAREVHDHWTPIPPFHCISFPFPKPHSCPTHDHPIPRWTLCATDRCFRYAAFVPFFRAAKVLPIARGGGLAQPGMAAAEARLAAGDWVHLFPEGTRSRDGVTLGPVRKGVGRLVASVPEDRPPPLLLPFVHRGMEGVMPRGKMLPATGQKVSMRVGRRSGNSVSKRLRSPLVPCREHSPQCANCDQPALPISVASHHPTIRALALAPTAFHPSATHRPPLRST